MDQGGRVQKFHHRGHANGTVIRTVAANRIIRKNRQRGTHALAAGAAQMIADVSNDLNVRARLPLEFFLDQHQFRRDEIKDQFRR